MKLPKRLPYIHYLIIGMVAVLDPFIVFGYDQFLLLVQADQNHLLFQMLFCTVGFDGLPPPFPPYLRESSMEINFQPIFSIVRVTRCETTGERGSNRPSKSS